MLECSGTFWNNLETVEAVLTGHVMEKCHGLKMQQDAQQSVKNNCAKGRKANKVQEAKVEEVVEFVGNASACSSLSDSSTPQNDSDFDWLADTGASSHMTPHHQWLHKYTSMHIPIKLADDTIVYSARVGTVVFNPVVYGKESRSVFVNLVLQAK